MGGERYLGKAYVCMWNPKASDHIHMVETGFFKLQRRLQPHTSCVNWYCAPKLTLQKVKVNKTLYTNELRVNLLAIFLGIRLDLKCFISIHGKRHRILRQAWSSWLIIFVLAYSFGRFPKLICFFSKQYLSIITYVCVLH